MVPARYGKKEFEVSPSKIYTPDGTSISESIDLEETERSGKKPSTSVKGIKLQTLSFDLKLDSRFVVVEQELRFWKGVLLGKSSDDFVLGKWWVGRFYLTQYSIKDFEINKNGDYTKATLTLTLTEDGNYAGKTTVNFSTKTANKSGGQSTSTKSNASANSVKASATTKVTTTSVLRVGSRVQPKSGTRWYPSAANAHMKINPSSLAEAGKTFTIKEVFGNGNAYRLTTNAWMRPEDFKIISP